MNSPSPSFNTYFNTDLAEIVHRVTADFAPLDYDADFDGITNEDERDLESYSEDDDFEFNLSSLSPADGEIRPVYPLFDRDLLRGFDLVCEVQSRAQIQLQTLFLEDRDGKPSSSSEEDDDLEKIPPGTYCVWTPSKSPVASPSPGRCTKSNSTGSSKKVKAWKLSDLMKRSKSEGKDGGRLMLLTPKKKAEAPDGRSARAAREGNASGRRREGAEKNRRRTFLPYREELLGFRNMGIHILPF